MIPFVARIGFDRIGFGMCLVLLLSSAPVAPAAAQESALDEVEALVASGRVDSARERLLAWWESGREQSEGVERQRALWLRGRLTVDPGMARRDYMRLVLEHPGGPYSAVALQRLAQGADAEGRHAAAADYYERILREYPESPHRLEARRWLEENRQVVARARDERAAARREAAAERAAPERAAPETAASEGADTAGEEAGSAPGPVAVQLGAFSSEERARSVLEAARSEGFDRLRLVRTPESDLVRVRAGRFPDREAADALRTRLQERGFDAVVVTDASRERAIR